jgi:hypothetical protein
MLHLTQNIWTSYRLNDVCSWYRIVKHLTSVLNKTDNHIARKHEIWQSLRRHISLHCVRSRISSSCNCLVLIAVMGLFIITRLYCSSIEYIITECGMSQQALCCFRCFACWLSYSLVHSLSHSSRFCFPTVRRVTMRFKNILKFPCIHKLLHLINKMWSCHCV